MCHSIFDILVLQRQKDLREHDCNDEDWLRRSGDRAETRPGWRLHDQLDESAGQNATNQAREERIQMVCASRPSKKEVVALEPQSSYQPDAARKIETWLRLLSQRLWHKSSLA